MLSDAEQRRLTQIELELWADDPRFVARFRHRGQRGPERAAGGDRPQIGLRQCPFLELAVSRSDVVCPVHLGLMQGAMQSWGSPITVDRLDPFVQPDLCVAQLSSIGAS